MTQKNKGQSLMENIIQWNLNCIHQWFHSACKLFLPRLEHPWTVWPSVLQISPLFPSWLFLLDFILSESVFCCNWRGNKSHISFDDQRHRGLYIWIIRTGFELFGFKPIQTIPDSSSSTHPKSYTILNPCRLPNGNLPQATRNASWHKGFFFSRLSARACPNLPFLLSRGRFSFFRDSAFVKLLSQGCSSESLLYFSLTNSPQNSPPGSSPYQIHPSNMLAVFRPRWTWTNLQKLIRWSSTLDVMLIFPEFLSFDTCIIKFVFSFHKSFFHLSIENFVWSQIKDCAVQSLRVVPANPFSDFDFRIGGRNIRSAAYMLCFERLVEPLDLVSLPVDCGWNGYVLESAISRSARSLWKSSPTYSFPLSWMIFGFALG